MKHSRKSKDTEQHYCDCEFCRAHYFSLELYKKALNNFARSQDENKLVHEAFFPIVRIVVPKSKWVYSQKYAFDDAQATALGNMFVYYRKKGELTGDERELWTLRKCAKAGCAYVVRQFRKHELPYTEAQDQQVDEKRLIGRRVYPNENTDFGIGGFTLLVDGLSADKYSEDSIVEQIDAKRFVIRVLTASDPKVVKQCVANLALKFKLFGSFNENPPTPLFVDALRAEIMPYAEASGLDKTLITDFCMKTESVFESESTVDMKRLLQKAYCREKTTVLTSLL